jgi:crotonobetainyl-CoA:carnitine CoA-transferase CaiB-like acyl-CoA transferase
VEPPPEGDNTRRLTGSGAGFFAAFQRNRRSLCVDVKAPEGLALVRRLLAEADVLIENFRPGALAKLGLDPAALRAANPRLVTCSCKGFLPGPYEHRTALDEVVQMMGGLAYMTGLPGRPLRAGSSVNDIMGGMFAAIGVLAALREREATGVGRHVESGLFETTALLMAQHMAQTAITGEEPLPMSIRRPAWPVYDIFDTADGEQMFVAAVTDGQWHAFCRAFGLDVTRAELVARCEALGLPYAPIGRPRDLLTDPHLSASGGLVPVTLPDGRQVGLPALPVALDGKRPGLRHDLPRVGQHSAEVAREAGLSEAEVAELMERGVLVAPTPARSV